MVCVRARNPDLAQLLRDRHVTHGLATRFVGGLGVENYD